jgi:hypothetical protein
MKEVKMQAADWIFWRREGLSIQGFTKGATGSTDFVLPMN